MQRMSGGDTGRYLKTNGAAGPRECLEIKNADGGKDYFVQQGGMRVSRLEACVPHDNDAERKKHFRLSMR